jgi:sugar phosphate permease
MERERTTRPHRLSPAIIAVLATLSTLTGYLTRVNISVALPFISQDFGWTPHEAALNGSLLLGMFLVGYGVSNIFIAPVIDRYGPRKGLMAIMLTWSLITFVTPFVGFIYWAFVTSRVVLGLSEGPLFPSASKLTQAWFGPRGRTAVNSFYFSSLYLSNLLVSIALVPLILLTSWHWAFYSIGIVGFVVVVSLYFVLQDTPQGPIATTGTRSTIGELMRNSISELRRTLKLKGIYPLAVSDIMTNLAWWGISLWLPTYLIQAKGLDLHQIVFAASIPYIGGVVGLYVGAWITQRSQRIAETSTVFAILCAVSIVLMIFTKSVTTTILVMSSVFFFISILQPNMFTLLQGGCPSNLIGSATGFLNGISVGMGAIGPILIGVSVAATGSFDIGLVILAAFQVICGLVLLLLRNQEEACDIEGRPAAMEAA